MSSWSSVRSYFRSSVRTPQSVIRISCSGFAVSLLVGKLPMVSTTLNPWITLPNTTCFWSNQRACGQRRREVLTHWSLGDLDGILKMLFSVLLYWLMPFDFLMPRNLTDDKSILIQVKARCRQATNHYLIQCWPRSMSPYGFTSPQWISINVIHLW